MDVGKRAMLVSLRISQWSARKYDKKASKEVAENHGTDVDSGRYTKKLLPVEAESYKALCTALGDIRTEHYKQTLAWSDEGWRLLPTDNYMSHAEMVRKLRARVDAALENFIREYPSLKDAARARLNGLYSEDDYPTVEKLTGKYEVKVEYSPLPAGGDFRLSLTAGELEGISAATDRRVKDAVEGAQRDAVERLRDVVVHIKGRLSSPGAIFRDSLITNAREVCDVLQRLNIGQDAKLEDLRRQVEALASTEPAAIRNSDFVRESAAKEADGILAAMAGIYGEAVTA